MITVTIIDEPAFEHNVYAQFAQDLIRVTEIDIEQAYTIIDWLEENGLTDYDMIKEKYLYPDQN